jgi:ABC-type nitrate/sulfonate/bicarbonate transport system substrate-binding protein
MSKSPSPQWFTMALAALVLGSMLSHADAQTPLKIRLGTGPSCVEEALCLMKARPDLTPNQGKIYDLEFIQFRAGDVRFQAYISRNIDGGTTSPSTLIQAAVKGVQTITVAAISAESPRTYSTSFLALDDGKINSVKDLKGTTIGIPGYRNTFELIARTELMRAGIDPSRDIKWLIVPTNATGQALRAGKISTGSFVQPFYAMETATGGVKTLFTSVSTLDLAEEFNIFFHPDFLQKHPDVVRTFLADFVAANRFYIDHVEEARRALLKERMVEIPAEIFLPMKNLEPIADARPSIRDWEKMQEHMLAVGFIESRVDILKMIDTSYLPPMAR